MYPHFFRLASIKDSVFVISDYKNKEVIIAVPSLSKWQDYSTSEKQANAGTCDLGYVFNWVENTWSKRDLPNITNAIYTILSVSEDDVTWEADTEGGIDPDDPGYPDSPAEFPFNPGVQWREAVDQWRGSYFKYNPADWGVAMTSGDGNIYTMIDEPAEGLTYYKQSKIVKPYLN